MACRFWNSWMALNLTTFNPLGTITSRNVRDWWWRLYQIHEKMLEEALNSLQVISMFSKVNHSPNCGHGIHWEQLGHSPDWKHCTWMTPLGQLISLVLFTEPLNWLKTNKPLALLTLVSSHLSLCHSLRGHNWDIYLASVSAGALPPPRWSRTQW